MFEGEFRYGRASDHASGGTRPEPAAYPSAAARSGAHGFRADADPGPEPAARFAPSETAVRCEPAAAIQGGQLGFLSVCRARRPRTICGYDGGTLFERWRGV